MTSRPYRLTRDLPASAPGNQFPRDLRAGDLLYRCTAPYAASLAADDGVMLTEDPDGGYPGYEVPLSVVEEVPASEARRPAAPAYDKAAHAIFHDEHCRCGHNKGVHSGRDADGRCVLRRCGCGKFEPAPDTTGQAATATECSYCGARITLLGDAWTDGDGTAACTDTSAPYVPHKPVSRG